MLNVLPPAAILAAVPPPANAPPQDLDALRDKMDASKAAGDREKLPGAAVYREHCRICHEGQAPKAPSRTFLQMMTPEAIDRALTVGIMQRQAATLTADDKKYVAEYLSGLPFGAPEPPEAPRCAGAAARFDLTREPDIVGWGFAPENTHFIDADSARLAAADIPRLEVKWTFAYPASVRARSRPTFAYGALYVGSQNGIVYALDAKTGCIRWTFETSAEVRTPVVIPATGGQTKRAFFGDIVGRVYAVDALTGKELWRDRVDDHPSATITGAPVYYRGTVYVGVSSLEEATADPSYACCTFRGSVVAYDAATGKRRWQRFTIDEAPHESGMTRAGTKIFAPSGAAIWNTPTIDAKRGLLYVGTGNNYTGPANGRSDSVLAVDLRSGRIVWSWQVASGDAWNVGCMIGLDSCPANSGPDFDIGSGIVLGKLASGEERLFVGLKSGIGARDRSRSSRPRPRGRSASDAAPFKAASSSAWPSTARACTCRYPTWRTPWTPRRRRATPRPGLPGPAYTRSIRQRRCRCGKARPTMSAKGRGILRSRHPRIHRSDPGRRIRRAHGWTGPCLRFGDRPRALAIRHDSRARRARRRRRRTAAPSEAAARWCTTAWCTRIPVTACISTWPETR